MEPDLMEEVRATASVRFHNTPRDLYDRLPFPERTNEGSRWKVCGDSKAEAVWFLADEWD